jgi:hypothetical protein
VQNKAIYNALQSLDALPSQTGHAGEYLTTDGTTASWGAVAGGGIQNESTNTGAIAIGGYNTTVGTNKGTQHSVIIGQSAQGRESSTSYPAVVVGYSATGNNGSVAVGRSANANKTSATYNTAVGARTDADNNGVAIGHYANAYTNAVAIGGSSSSSNKTYANGDGAIAIGSKAVANGAGTIQIGTGTNSNAGTVQVGTYPLLDATGTIVAERLPAGSGADTSLSNLTDAGKIAIAHNASIGELYDTLTPASQTYTAPADGYFYVMGVSTTRDGAIAFYRTNNSEAFSSSPLVFRYGTTNNVSVVAGYCPCKKGDRIAALIENMQFTYSGYSNLGMKFFYAVGSESEQGA